MALRLGDSVVCGVIDNREKGKVTGALWFAGQYSPVRLELIGNCDDDLAGCLLEFTNRDPQAVVSLRELETQFGEAGTITAAKKVRTIPKDTSLEDLTKENLERWGWSSSLYLEWFSRSNGRVVVEIVDPELRISLPGWEYTADEKAKMEGIAVPKAIGFIQKIEIDVGEDDERRGELQHDKLLQKFDEYVARFEELWERYRDDPDADQKIADELGLILVEDDADLEELEEDFEEPPGE
jgi:hypothetical protein